jgi:hypothetical protein
MKCLTRVLTTLNHASVVAAVALLWISMPSSIAEAGTISLSTEVTTTLKPGAVTVAVKVTNSGDEAAQTVVPTLRFAGKDTRLPGTASLPPRQTMEASVELPFAQATAGQWPLVATTDYADSNGYPFQALQVSLVSSPGALPALIAIVGMDADLVHTTGRIRARLKSLSDAAQSVRPQLYLPRGLELAAPVEPLSLSPWAEAELSARIVNRAALAGSRYPAFLTVEYDDAAGHHAAIGHSVLEIRAPRASTARYAWIAAAALVLAWLALLAWRRIRARPPLS